MKKSLPAVSVLLLMSVLLGACNLSPAQPTQIPADQINTIAAQTVAALTTQMAPPPATATNTAEPATATPGATPTLIVPTVNLTPLTVATNTLIPLPTTVANTTECNKVFFLSDDTIPDNTVLAQGEKFTKTWSIQNNGSCTWNTNYYAMAVLNDPTSPTINGDGAYYVKSPVAPGAIWKYSVQLIAPKENGTYTQYWKMVDDAGNQFGIGGTAGAGWYVKIKVTKNGESSSSGLSIATKVISVSPTTVNAGDKISADISITLDGLDSGDEQEIVYKLAMDGKVLSGCSGSETWSDDGTKEEKLTGCEIPANTAGGDKAITVYISSPGGSNAATPATLTVNP